MTHGPFRGGFRARWLEACLVWVGALAGCGATCSWAQGVAGPAPSGGMPAVVADLERLTVSAIERAGASVVAIARVRLGTSRSALPGDAFDAFSLSGPPREVTDSDFIPSDYGSGVVVDASGLILTNFHVVDDPESRYFVTTHQRRSFEARVKAGDPRSDLAILEIRTEGSEPLDLEPIALGDGGAARKGQFVIALGNPYAIARDGQASASWGIVANLGRKAGPPTSEQGAPLKQGESRYLGSLIQTDARLNLGTSGGALVNLAGEMIGLTTSQAALAGYEQSAGFAIAVDATFRQVLEVLKQGREVEYGFLGVQPQDLTFAERSHGRAGARIYGIVRHSPAARAGLRLGDVVTAINGKSIFDKDGLFLEIGSQPVEAVVQLTVERDGQSVGPLIAELTKADVPGRKVATAPRPVWRGLRLDYALLQRVVDLADRLPGGEGEEPDLYEPGVRVIGVEPGSPAEAAGLQENQLITHVAGVAIDSPREFFEAVADQQGAEISVRLGEKAEPAVRTVGVEP